MWKKGQIGVQSIGFGLAIALFSFMLARASFVFFSSNTVDFSLLSLRFFLGAIRFDLAAAGYVLWPWALIELGLGRAAPGARKRDWLFLFGPIFAVSLLSAIDSGYFPYSGRRLTWDFFKVTDLENQGPGQVLEYVRDFWRIGLGLLFTSSLTLFSMRALGRTRPHRGSVIQAGIALLVFALLARGGVGKRPLSLQSAGEFAQERAIPWVLNTGFSILRTAGKRAIQMRPGFLPEEAETRFPVRFHVTPTIRSERPLNLVVLILESFSAEYSGFLTERTDGGFTPFLDTLMQKSAVWPASFANATRSIHAPPSIFAGVPPWMSDPFVLSVYNTNRIQSLAQILKTKGYKTAFFHGGANGTMGFDTFAAHAGFDQYWGLNEYTGDLKNDRGVWGVHDRPYYQEVIKRVGELKAPFAVGVFTLSSHHPFELPESERGKFPKGSHPIHSTIAYADDALREFFLSAEKQSWYRDTIFLITADHTGPRLRDHSGPKRLGQVSFPQIMEDYRVPFVLYAPGGQIPAALHPEWIQHLDVLPTALSAIGQAADLISFGRDHLDPRFKNTLPWMVWDHELLQAADTEGAVAFDPDKETNSPRLKEFQEILDQFRSRMIQNRLTPE
jgi:arylsulfatase A-like enzyme